MTQPRVNYLLLCGQRGKRFGSQGWNPLYSTVAFVGAIKAKYHWFCEDSSSTVTTTTTYQYIPQAQLLRVEHTHHNVLLQLPSLQS